MKQREDGAAVAAADAGRDRRPARMAPESADHACDDVTVGFWNRIIHALAFVPEMPQAQIWHLPRRRD